MAETIPYPLPAGSWLLQDLGFLAFMLPQVATLMPTQKPRGQELTLEQHVAYQALTPRALEDPSGVLQCAPYNTRQRRHSVAKAGSDRPLTPLPGCEVG